MELKDYPTDEDYDEEYWSEFIKSQTAHRNELMKFSNIAGDNNELKWLSGQMFIIGIKQASMKSWLLKNVDMDPDLNDWPGEIPAQLREKIMAFQDLSMPKWQRKEAIYIIDMYYEMLVEMDEMHKKRLGGQ